MYRDNIYTNLLVFLSCCVGLILMFCWMAISTPTGKQNIYKIYTIISEKPTYMRCIQSFGDIEYAKESEEEMIKK